MGSGAWTNVTASTYSTSRGIDLSRIKGNTVNQFYRTESLCKDLDPKNVIRECLDNDEHPNTIPIILALDVTGSMGSACAAVARKLNEIMTILYQNYKDIEFCIMGIGDLAYDDAPIQMSQYESDIRIIEHLDKIFFERGGGGNSYESYSAAWYMGLYHTKLDCWKRGRKGIIITLGDESLNPYLPKINLQNSTGDSSDHITDTKMLYEEAKKKFDIYHIAISDIETEYDHYKDLIKSSFGKLLGQRLIVSESENLPKVINAIIEDSCSSVDFEFSIDKSSNNESGVIHW